jgi:tetratricopeptide (TPR) repeat protein
MNLYRFSTQRRILLPILFCSIVLLLLSISVAMAQEAGRIVSVVGKVEVFRTQQWQPVGLRHVLAPGDVVRTGPGSRVAILLSDEVQIKVNANSTLEIAEVMPPPGKPTRAAVGPLQTILNLLRGEIWSRSRGRPLQIRTPSATATIRGTEFDLSISPANESRLAVLEGAVEFRNPQGGVVVKAGEEATARVGEPPSKTLLLKPLDAVQWSLYYPGIVSFQDYPLTGIAQNLLSERLVDAEQRVTSGPADPEARLTLGEILFDMGRPGEARREFERALAFDPGSPRALTGLGWVYLVEGRPQEALRAFRQTTPSPLSALVGQANALHRLDRLDEMEEVVTEAKDRFPSSPQPPTQAALLYLIQGRVAEARQELEQTLTLDPGYALAHGLRSNIALVRNEKELAHQAALQAIAANPFSASAYLDLSLVKQAEFRLEEALQAARKAVKLDPENPQAMIQVSRLLFGFGRLSEALSMAEQARRRAPQDPLITSTWGFLLLTQVKVQEALTAFDQAIEQDSTRGEPHLGRGLALFRQNKTEEAVQEMWMATLLEPKVSLFWSYLGKALYEVKRYPEEIDPLAIAKRLDPNDPTPWLYDAIRKQSVNRPVEALEDLQRSIGLNDNRAVYRSRFLLDEDLATRGATLARLYDELGFQQLALVEGWRAAIEDPSNYSAHRFLSDSYAALPRHEVARVSELLQSQLLQPISMTPVQPQLAESNLFILDGAGPQQPSLNEYNPLFVRDRVALLVSGTGGEKRTFGDEAVLSGVWGNISYSLGQFHHETNGFRKNNDQNQDIYNAFGQLSLSPNTSVQAEFRYKDFDRGDLPLRFRFGQNNLFPDRTQDDETRSIRLGLHHAFAPDSHLIASGIYRNLDVDTRLCAMPLVAGVCPLPSTFVTGTDGFMGEVQHLLRWRQLHLITGVGHFDGNRTDDFNLPSLGFSIATKDDRRHTNLYLYSLINFPHNVTWTLGGSGDFFKVTTRNSEDGRILGTLERNQFNPKFGVTWNPFPNTTLRGAVFKVVKRSLLSDQTIEPTHVAGFNQLFDDADGAKSWRYGAAIDQKFSTVLSGGVELSRRDIDMPFSAPQPDGTLQFPEADWQEDLGRAYLYWTPHSWLAMSAEYQYERFRRRDQLFGEEGIAKSYTHRVPLGINLFHPSGLRARLRTTYVDQVGDFTDVPTAEVSKHGSDQFWVVDASIGYRLPDRRGLFTIDVRNLFDNSFHFHDTNSRSPTVAPERQVLVRFTLAF